MLEERLFSAVFRLVIRKDWLARQEMTVRRQKVPFNVFVEDLGVVFRLSDELDRVLDAVEDLSSVLDADLLRAALEPVFKL